MNPKTEKHNIWPSVVAADKKTEMRIIPAARTYLFEDGEYLLDIRAVNADEANYHAPTVPKLISVMAKDGIIAFEYAFPGEGEHLITLKRDGTVVNRFRIYSLYPDLYAMRPLKGDLHSHSHRSDGVNDASALAGYYREYAYEFFALTDHNRFYPGIEIDETYNGVKLGIVRIPGEEVHPPKTAIHIVNVGGKESVADLYIRGLSDYQSTIDEKYLPLVPDGIPESYRDRYAKVIWATEKIHESGGIAIMPHPYWRAKGIYNNTDDFAATLYKSGLYDAFEIVGAMGIDGISRAVCFWAEMGREGASLPLVGSSDAHNVEDGRFSNCFTVAFAREHTADAIIDSVRAGMSVAVEATTGVGGERQYRVYGSVRLNSYAQYLLNYYYPRLEHIARSEGVTMRNYAMGFAPASLIELEREQSDAFRMRFFGKLPVELDADVREFYERAEERHGWGPAIAGTMVDGVLLRDAREK